MLTRTKILVSDNQKGKTCTIDPTKIFSAPCKYLVSRSQARHVLFGLEKFKVIVFDFTNVPVVGQAFADEIFRVFQQKHPEIRLDTENMSEGVKFMVKRAIDTAKQ